MRVWCAWCGKLLVNGPPEELESHGICEECLAAKLAEIEQKEGAPDARHTEEPQAREEVL